MDTMFQDLDLSQIKVGAGSRFPAEGGATADYSADEPTSYAAADDAADADNFAAPLPMRAAASSRATREDTLPLPIDEESGDDELATIVNGAPAMAATEPRRSSYSDRPRPPRSENNNSDRPRPPRSENYSDELPGTRSSSNEEGILKVSSQSRHSAVAGAIARVLRQQDRAEVQAIGAAACYQAIKAVATARNYLLPEGIDLSCVPMFTDVSIGEHERTAIRFIVTRTLTDQAAATDESGLAGEGDGQ